MPMVTFSGGISFEIDETEDVVSAFAARYGDIDVDQVTVVRQFDCIELRAPKYRVDLSGTMFQGIGYLGSSQFPPPTARHDTVFYGFRVEDFVRVLHGDHARLLLPIAYDGRTVLRRVPEETPLNPNGRSRSPVQFDDSLVKPHVRQRWKDFWEQEQSRTDHECRQRARTEEEERRRRSTKNSPPPPPEAKKKQDERE